MGCTSGDDGSFFTFAWDESNFVPPETLGVFPDEVIGVDELAGGSIAEVVEVSVVKWREDTSLEAVGESSNWSHSSDSCFTRFSHSALLDGAWEVFSPLAEPWLLPLPLPQMIDSSTI